MHWERLGSRGLCMVEVGLRADFGYASVKVNDNFYVNTALTLSMPSHASFSFFDYFQSS
jgi:hypothetical protein